MTTATAALSPARGRALLWVGVAVCLLGPPLFFLQFAMKRMFVPWYSPALATLGAAIILLSVLQRGTVVRFAALVLVGAFAAFQWYFLGVELKLPEYAGPAVPGERLPAFSSTYADGKAFTDSDLRDGSRRVMVFFRGRW